MREAMITQLRILKMSNIKPNFSELARQYDMDRRTVKKYYDGYEGKPRHRRKSSRLDEHYETIKNKLSLRGANVRAVYEYILEEVDANVGTYSNFNKYIKSRGLKPKKTGRGHPRYETAMGIQAQVDWKEDVTIRNCHGEPFTFQVFDYKLGYSRYPVFIYRLYKTRQDVFDCLIASFRATGGVPKEILFDNMPSVVDRDGRRANISNEMRMFAKDMGFSIKLCKPRHAFTKGKVEALNKFLSWLVPYDGEFETEEELVSILESINRRVCGRVCDETGVPPVLLFQKEKEYLQPLPSEKVIDSYLSHDRQTTVRKDSMVTYMKCKYSVPAEYIGKPVRIKASGDSLCIYYSTDLIASHRISDRRLNYKKDHYTQLLAGCGVKPDDIEMLAQTNLRQMDAFL